MNKELNLQTSCETSTTNAATNERHSSVANIHKVTPIVYAHIVVGVLEFCLRILGVFYELVTASRLSDTFRQTLTPDRHAKPSSSILQGSIRFSVTVGSTKRPLKPVSSPVCKYDRLQRCCVYMDGSPAMVPPGHRSSVLPKTYVEQEKRKGGDVKSAKEAWKATQNWRKEKNVWNALSDPFIQNVNNFFPYVFHGYTKDGYPVIYPQVAKMNPSVLFSDETNMTPEIFAWNFVQTVEFACSHLGARRNCDGLNTARVDTKLDEMEDQDVGFVLVLDANDIVMGHVKGKMRDAVAQVIEILQAHYPGILKSVIVINAPYWTSAVVRGFNSRRLGCDVVCSSTERKNLEEMRRLIDDTDIPRELGGSSTFPFEGHPSHIHFQQVTSPVEQHETSRTASFLTRRMSKLTPYLETINKSFSLPRQRIVPVWSKLRLRRRYRNVKKQHM